MWLPNRVAIQVRIPTHKQFSINSLLIWPCEWSPMSHCKCCVSNIVCLCHVFSFPLLLFLLPQPQSPQARTGSTEFPWHPLCQRLARHAVSVSFTCHLSRTRATAGTCKTLTSQEMCFVWKVVFDILELRAHRVPVKSPLSKVQNKYGNRSD